MCVLSLSFLLSLLFCFVGRKTQDERKKEKRTFAKFSHTNSIFSQTNSKFSVGISKKEKRKKRVMRQSLSLFSLFRSFPSSPSPLTFSRSLLGSSHFGRFSSQYNGNEEAVREEEGEKVPYIRQDQQYGSGLSFFIGNKKKERKRT